MRLLFLSFYFRPDLCAGSFRATALVDALRDRGASNDLEIDVITTLPNRYATFSEEAAEIESCDNIKIRRIDLPAHRSDMVGQSRAFMHFARCVLGIVADRQYDMIFATSSRLFTATLGAYVSRRKKIPLYLDIRDIFVDTIRDIISPIVALPAGVVFSLIERYTMSRASTINLVSGGFEDYFRTRYPDKKLSWFTNGVDAEFIGLPKHDAKKANTVTRILYAGNIGEGQCLHDIVPQLAKVLGKRAELVVIGDGGRRQLLEEAIAAHGADNVSVQPPVARPELIQEYQSADVLFLHLGDYQAFEKVLPSKLFEYGALGKPVLAGVAGFAAEFVEREISNAAVFPPGNVDLARKAFERLRLEDAPRNDFVRKYSRNSISAEMATEIIRAAASNPV